MIDVVIVGGGPVGLAAAIEARLAGLTVTVIEPRTGPLDKACGEGLMPGALEALHRLGVDPPGHVIAGISYQDARRRVDHGFRHRVGRGVRRTVLHAALADRASELGVEVVAAKVHGIRQSEESVTALCREVGSGAEPGGAVGDSMGSGEVAITARWMFGADGLHSTVRELVGLAVPSGTARRFGLRRHFEVAPWNDLVEVHWTALPGGARAEIYVTPVGPREVGVAVLGPMHTDYAEAVGSVARLAERLDGTATTSTTRGAGPLRQRTRARTAGRMLLLGDASGYVDAITGEGLRVGFAQAAAAVECVVRGGVVRGGAGRAGAGRGGMGARGVGASDVGARGVGASDVARDYEVQWRRVTRDYRLLTSGLVALGASPLRGAIVPAASALPGVYGAIVERLAR